MPPKPPILDYVSAPKRARRSWTLIAALVVAPLLFIAGTLLIGIPLMLSPGALAVRGSNPAIGYGVILIILALRCGYEVCQPSKDSILRWHEKPLSPIKPTRVARSVQRPRSD